MVKKTQEGAGKRRPVEAAFIATGERRVAFRIGDYDRDRELVCGIYLVDQRTPGTTGSWEGLSDRPDHFEIEWRHGDLRVTDPTMTTPRAIRDHRALIRQPATREPQPC